MEFRLTQRHIVAINFLLIGGIAYLAALCVNGIALQSLIGAPPVPPPVSIKLDQVDKNRTRAYYETIVKRDVFNLTAPKAPPPVVATIDLHMKLLGIALATRDKPYAIVEDQSGEQWVYTVGDEIPDAGRVLSVEKSRIVILHGDQQVTLDLPHDELPGGVGSASTAPPPRVQRRRRRD